MSLVALAHNFLEFFGKSAKDISLEEWQANGGTKSLGHYSRDEYPLVCTPLDTAGEKEVEEFSQPNEQVVSFTPELSRIITEPTSQNNGFLNRIELWISDPAINVTVGSIRSEIATIVEGFYREENSETLDSRI